MEYVCHIGMKFIPVSCKHHQTLLPTCRTLYVRQESKTNTAHQRSFKLLSFVNDLSTFLLRVYLRLQMSPIHHFSLELFIVDTTGRNSQVFNVVALTFLQIKVFLEFIHNRLYIPAQDVPKYRYPVSEIGARDRYARI